MNIKINSVHFTADRKLEEFLENKIKKLSLFHEILSAEIFLRLENTQDLENKITEIKLNISGAELFAKKQSNTFEKAADDAVEALKRQITKHKEKIRGI